MSQMFAVAKLAGMACRVKPEGSRQRETELGGSVTRNLRRCAGIDSKRADLNYSNRPVRTRMPGGVGVAPCKRMKFSGLRWPPWQSLASSRVPSLAWGSGDGHCEA